MTKRYTLKRRAERQAETRRRIVGAAVELHSTVGPAATTITAVADRAGVQRHTVYAHFPDDVSLFRACSSHFRELHPFPDVTDLDLREALERIYSWYAQLEHPLTLFARDAALYPEIASERRRRLSAVANALAASFGRRKVSRAAVGHALELETWRSLVRQQCLSQRQAVDAMVRFVEGVR